jgi:hypothetical protein
MPKNWTASIAMTSFLALTALLLSGAYPLPRLIKVQ